MSDVTQILSAIEQGDPRASEQLLPLVYEELRRLAAQKMASPRSDRAKRANCVPQRHFRRSVPQPLHEPRLARDARLQGARRRLAQLHLFGTRRFCHISRVSIGEQFAGADS